MKKKILTHGALFQGIGGFSLAARWAGIPTIWECEIDNYCHELSKKNFPEIKTRYRDIRKMLNEKTKIEKVSIISGGFPCQPFSTAGKRRGKEDNRYLWPQTIKIIEKTRPGWVILENVPGIINLALDKVLDDLEAAGYTQETFVIPALSVGANHRRDRVWVIANNDRINSNNTRLRRTKISQQQPSGIYGVMADTTANRCRFFNDETRNLQKKKEIRERRNPINKNTINGKWSTEPRVDRVAHGVPRRVDRLKGLGNAIVPQIAYIFFEFIKEIEELP
jgi:DNA (cytosine-5)-methyltransferase 1